MNQVNLSGEKISYYESPIYNIVNSLVNKGYRITNAFGLLVDELDNKCVGILEPRESVRSFLGIKIKQRGLHLSNLWLNEPSLGAEEDKKWVMCVYGRENIPN